MFSLRAIRKPFLDPMIFRHLHKNIWVISIAAFLLLCLSMPSFHYFSSYTNKITIIGLGLPKSQKAHVEEDICSGRYIYIHDLPPRFNKDLISNCRALSKWFDFCPYLKNRGFGPRLKMGSKQDSRSLKMSSKSWYATNQFMLSVIFHNRMKKYECLTSNSSLASAIYAPFYPGLEIGQHLWGGFNTTVRDAAAVDFATWLREKPEWARMDGRDHFFVAGRINWDFRRLSNVNANWGSKLLNLPEVKNMTMLTIESSPYGYNDFAIPYPTYFHPSNDSEVLKWQDRVRRAKRSYLFAFGGAPRPNDTSSIRGELINQCEEASKNRCKLVNCVASDNCNSPIHFIKMYMKSIFCLQPPGDSYTRRSTFDSILAGCIPVFFHPGSAYTQYLWHFPKNYTKYSVFIPEGEIRNRSLSVEEVLSQISDNDVLAMREEVIKMIPKITYSSHKLETIEDAFDVTVKKVLERIEDSRRKVREGKDPNTEFPEQWSWKYYLTGKIEKHEWDVFF